jgi:RHS repeat-associated protein
MDPSHDNHTTSIQSPLAAQNQTTSYGYNARGEQTSLTDAASFGINYTYDENGNPLTIVNRNNGTFSSTYYDDNRLWTSQTPSGKTTTRTYIKRGMLASVAEPSGQQTTFTYDDRGRLQSRTDPVGASNYAYDKNNNLLTHTENGKTITRVYDNNNRLTSYTDENNNVIGYEYDKNGNLTKLTYPGGTKYVNYDYDSNNRLTTVTDWASRVTRFTYDLAGRLTSVTRPNGTIRTISYDAAGQMTEITEATSAGAAIAYSKLTYDEAGRIIDEFIAPIPATFTEASETITYDADNRIATFNGHTVVHDLDGNMTSGPLNSSISVAHAFDARNRLTAVAGSGMAPALSYAYDSEGNRTGVIQGGQTTSFIISPATAQALVRAKPDGTKTYYVYGQGLLYQVDDAGSTVTYHYDYRGSTVALTGSSGQVTDRVEYNTYGLITLRTGSTDTPFLYNGRYGVMTDANGLYYMRARYYNPYIKRFINADPSGFEGGLNLYAFADGNPI